LIEGYVVKLQALSTLLLIAIISMPIAVFSTTPSTTLHVYEDGVAVSITYVDKYSYSWDANLSAVLDVGSNYFRVSFNLNSQQATAETPGHPVYGAEQLLAFNFSLTGQPQDSKYTTTIRFGFSLETRSGRLEARSDNIVLVFDTVENVEKITGVVWVTAAGEYAFILNQLSTLNKTVVEQSLNQSGIEGVEISKLDVAVTDSVASIDFDIAINNTALNQSLTRIMQTQYGATYTTPLVPSTSLTQLKTPINLEVSLTASTSRVEARSELYVGCDVNEVLKPGIEYLKQFIQYYQYYSYLYTTYYPTDASNVSKLIGILDSLKEYRILPSKASLEVIASSKGGFITAKLNTPKFIKESGTLTDTVRSLYSTGLKLADLAGNLSLADVTVQIATAPNIAVTLNKASVSQVLFPQLAFLDVAVVTPQSQTTTPATTSDRSPSTPPTRQTTEAGAESTLLIALVAVVLAAAVAVAIAFLIKWKR